MDKKSELREKAQHGSAIFPFNVYENLFVYENNTFLPHWHDEFEMIYLENGLANFSIDGSLYKLVPGQFLFVNCGSIHSGQAVDNPEAYAIVFHLRMLFSDEVDICKNKYLIPLQNRKVLVSSFIQDENVKEDICEIIKYFKQKDYGYELMIKGLLFKIIFRLFNNNYVKKDLHDKDFGFKLEKIKTVLDYINSNYSTPLKIEELSKMANLSKFYFCRLFKEITHLTPVDYINKFRIERAVEFIKNTDMSISDIAFEVGFNNISYFIKIFKRYIGVTPLQYKKGL